MGGRSNARLPLAYTGLEMRLHLDNTHGIEMRLHLDHNTGAEMRLHLDNNTGAEMRLHLGNNTGLKLGLCDYACLKTRYAVRRRILRYGGVPRLLYA
jgi:hypothetical protein